MTPIRALHLYGTPCAGCGQPARELILYRDVQVVVHMVGDLQQPCRFPAPPSGRPLPPPPRRPVVEHPMRRPVEDIELPDYAFGGAS